MVPQINKESLIAVLRAHEPELKAAGIIHLHLFGSRVNGTARDNSDVDLAAIFDRAKVRGILAEVGLKNRLSEILGVDADLANAELLKEGVQENFEREAELVFKGRAIFQRHSDRYRENRAVHRRRFIRRFQAEPMHVAAVERYLLTISEAAIRLGNEAETLCPSLPWPNIRGIGNWIRHQYDRIDLETVWHTATAELTPLKASVSAALQRLQDAPGGPAAG